MYKQVLRKKGIALLYMIPFGVMGLLALALLEFWKTSGVTYSILQAVVIFLTAVGMFLGYLKGKVEYLYYFFSDELLIKMKGRRGEPRLLLSIPLSEILAIYPRERRCDCFQDLKCTRNFVDTADRIGRYYLVAKLDSGFIKICFEPDAMLLSHLEEAIPKAFQYK